MKTSQNSENLEYLSSNRRNRIVGKGEREFLNRCRAFPNLVLTSRPHSQQEGFEWYFQEFGETPIKTRGKVGINRFRIFAKYGRKLMRGLSRSYKDLKPYLLDLKENGKYSNFEIQKVLKTYPNEKLWIELQDYAKTKWNIVKIGFTELPQALIFKNKMVLFQHALVFMQEMNKDKIDKAPGKEAGDETIRIYAELGEAVADIAEWLRRKGIRSQAVHPLGGLVCTPPLAGKAGMGGQGKQGCLITPEFGPRQRLAPIFIEEKVFKYTDSNEHDWIQEYCKKCGNCQKSCPVDAIYDEKIISIDNIQGIGAMKTCIDKEKCFPYFGKTMGCSICLKVCPFSEGPKSYYALKRSIK